jgi:hypothetical protein
MATTVVHGNVNSLGEAYKDQTPSVEIRVPYSRAAGLPYQTGERVSVKLKLGKRWYDGKLHASAGTKFVYFSPTLTREGTETTLGHVLRKFRVGPNERVQLQVRGTRIQVRDKWGNGLHTSASRINRQIGTEPKTLAEIHADSGVRKPARFFPHMKSLRDIGLVRQLDDGRYVEAGTAEVAVTPKKAIIAERIIRAIGQHLGNDLARPFRSGVIRKLTGVEQGSFSPILKGMRDDPGSAPAVRAEFQGVLHMISEGVYRLTARGQDVVRSLSLSAPLQAEGSTGTRYGGGTGFGTPENNKAVEDAARDAVRAVYEADGWDVEVVEHLKLGHDLTCRKEGLQEHVEVKGVSGSEQSFPITGGEVGAAKRDPKWHLCVVTSTLSPERRKVTKYSRDDFLVKFDLKVIQYMAKLSR